MTRLLGAPVLVAALVCHVTGSPSRVSNLMEVISGLTGWNGREPDRETNRPIYSRIPKGPICKFNSTLLDIDYHVGCDLPEFFECVEGTPEHRGHLSAGRRPRPAWLRPNFPFGGSQGLSSLFRRPVIARRPTSGRRPALDKTRWTGPLRRQRSVFGLDSGFLGRMFGGLRNPFRSLHAEVGYCQQRTCSGDHECAPDFSCIDGHCNITSDIRMFAAACNVTSDEDGAVLKERACLGECGGPGRQLTVLQESATAHFCTPRRQVNTGMEQVMEQVSELLEDTVDLIDALWSDVYEDFRNGGWASGGSDDDHGETDWRPFGDEDDIWASLFGGRSPFRPHESDEHPDEEDTGLSSPDELPSLETLPDEIPPGENLPYEIPPIETLPEVNSDVDETEPPANGGRVVKIPE